jgi:hypothetical protein
MSIRVNTLDEKYQPPPGDLGLLASANRSMSAQLTSIRGALGGEMGAEEP